MRYKCSKCLKDFHKIRIDLNDPLKLQVCEKCYWSKDNNSGIISPCKTVEKQWHTKAQKT